MICIESMIDKTAILSYLHFKAPKWLQWLLPYLIMGWVSCQQRAGTTSPQYENFVSRSSKITKIMHEIREWVRIFFRTTYGEVKTYLGMSPIPIEMDGQEMGRIRKIETFQFHIPVNLYA